MWWRSEGDLPYSILSFYYMGSRNGIEIVNSKYLLPAESSCWPDDLLFDSNFAIPLVLELNV